MRGARDRLAHNPGRFHSRVFDKPAVFRMVSAIHIMTGQIDNDVSAVDFRCPWTKGFGIPGYNAPSCLLWPSTENYHFVPGFMERSREDCSDLSCTAGDYYFHICTRLSDIQR
jgi:hypothetical protein